MADYPHLKWQMDDGVGRLTLCRPPLNILNIAMLRELQAALGAAADESTLRVLVLAAEGKMFSAGVDIADHTADKVAEMIPLFDRVCEALAQFPAPTLAAVHGHALGGGCELVLCCDLALAAEGANLGQPEIKLATIAPVASLRLPALVGPRRAAELLLTGEPVSAVQAAQMGMINRAVPAEQLPAAVAELTSRLKGLSAAALRAAKRTLLLGRSDEGSLAAVEKLYLDELMSTRDAHEGVATFIAKRPPVWTHR